MKTNKVNYTYLLIDVEIKKEELEQVLKEELPTPRLAENIGISKASIYNFLQGKQVGLSILLRVCDWLEQPLSKYLSYEEI